MKYLVIEFATEDDRNDILDVLQRCLAGGLPLYIPDNKRYVVERVAEDWNEVFVLTNITEEIEDGN